jgi:Tol biopolymer transport system component
LSALAVSMSADASLQREPVGIVWAQADGIYGANIDGSERHVITSYDGGFVPDYFAAPVWSPDGRVLAYNNCDSGACMIHLVGGNRRRTIRRYYVENDPTWSPDGRELAVQVSNTDCPICGMGISAISVATTRARMVTPPKYGRWDDDPAWSPDGQTIAIVREVVNQDTVIYLVGADGRNATWLTRGAAPSWSPDGSQLVFARGNSIFTIRRNGAGRKRITVVSNTEAELIAPQWSQDGRRILYQVDTFSRRPSIWTMNSDGTHRTRVVTIRADNGSNLDGANWTPAAR